MAPNVRVLNVGSEFSAFKNGSEFLQLSFINIFTLLASDNIPADETDMLEIACRWAKAECARRHLKPSGENMRIVLGNCIFEIRFPLMTQEEFTRCINSYNILAAAEIFEIFKYITYSENKRGQLNVIKMNFKIRPRHLQRKNESIVTDTILHLDLTTNLTFYNDLPFICDGGDNYNRVATKRKIRVYGLSFLGPLDGDAIYNVTIRIDHYKNKQINESYSNKVLKKKVFALQGQIFRVMFDGPITFREGSLKTWTDYYHIHYALRGPNTKSFNNTFWKNTIERYQENEFRIHWYSNQMAEILFKNIS